MSRLAGVSGRQARRVAESFGWVYQRTSGDHMVFTKDGVTRNLSIPDHREISPGTLRQNIRVMGLTVDEFIARLKG